MLNGFASYIIPHASAAADAVVESRRRASRLSRASGAHARRRLAGLGSSSEAVRCYGWSRGEHGDGRGGSHAGGREVEGLQFVAHGELGVHTVLAVVGQRARPKADGQSCTLATPRGSSIRVPIGRLSPEAFSRGVFASGRENRSARFFLVPSGVRPS